MTNTAGYYDRFSMVYDRLSPEKYYRAAREAAVTQLRLEPGYSVLNVACGTGQNFPYFQNYLGGQGRVVGVDLSAGMLGKARAKVKAAGWENVELLNANAETLSLRDLANALSRDVEPFDAVICDLGLTAMQDWQRALQNMIAMVKPGGRIVIMDWYLPKASLRRSFVNWIGKADASRPIAGQLQLHVSDFHVDNHFNRGGVFVASGTV